MAALVFKVVMDQGRKMTYLRVYSGKITVGADVLNVRTGQKEKIARLLRIHSNKRERINEALAGDIIGVIGLKTATTGDTITEPDHPLILESIPTYEPVINVAVEPKVSADLEKVISTLGKLTEEDPTFRYRLDEDTGQTIVSGMGELHLDVLVHRLKREYSVELNVGKPQVVYRETITQETEAEGIFDRDLGGTPHYAGVRLKVRTLPRGQGIHFRHEIEPDTVPLPFFPGSGRRRPGKRRQRGHHGLPHARPGSDPHQPDLQGRRFK